MIFSILEKMPFAGSAQGSRCGDRSIQFPGDGSRLLTSPVSSMMSGILVALLAGLDMLFMCAAAGAGAVFALAFPGMRRAGILVALFAGLDMLFMRAAAGAGTMRTLTVRAVRRACVFMALFTSLDVLFMAAALIGHFFRSFY
ncbi:hypothetical protein LDL36_07245 [Komagataeibacter sp. FNDCR1]|nr:hypothetical protein [Komagataeibacter sp. FNDCR1]